MKADLIRCFRNPIYWLDLGAGLSVQAVLAYFDSRFHSDAFWSLSAEFWNKIGSVTLGFLVLLVLIRLFSADRETGVFPVINSTAYGRITLFRNRLIAGSIAASAGAALLAAGIMRCQFSFPAGFPNRMVGIMHGSAAWRSFSSEQLDFSSLQHLYVTV